MKLWLLQWLLLNLAPHNYASYHYNGYMQNLSDIINNRSKGNFMESVEIFEGLLEREYVQRSSFHSVPGVMAFHQRIKGPFKGLEICANEKEAHSDRVVPNCTVKVQLPRELAAASDNTITCCLISWPEANKKALGDANELFVDRMVGLIVHGKRISGLRQGVNISMMLDKGVNDTQKLRCVFYNFRKRKYSSDGCRTLWERGQSHVTCSCDHLTYFGVLMVSASLSDKDQEILMYISQIGCGLSLVALVLAVVIFITNRSVRDDTSMKIHISLAIALILLNIHFIQNHSAVVQSSPGLCLYMAVCLHYSLLAIFTWMALEGFHIYLLLVRVFNIYVNKYLLKLSVVGWGIPAVIVSLVAIVDRDAYGPAPLDSSNPNSTAICYITNDTVKLVTTVGAFGLVFVFNVVMFGMTAKRVASLRHLEEHNSAKRGVCTMLGITTLLGITWGLVFFSFGHLTVPALYLFCILNSLQGVFIFLWFVMFLRKNRNSAAERTNQSHGTSS